ncbi:MAG TPA: leucyl aminopeptidase family protein [Burkholderiales bacterium]|nr:leucyl aminopeptidase family protein [Burkholderiales bacterium]
MLAKLAPHASVLSVVELAEISHVLFVLPKSEQLPVFPGSETLRALLKRRAMKASQLAGTPLFGTLPHGGLAAWTMLDLTKPVFEQHTVLRKAVQPLLEENPKTLCISVHGTRDERAKAGHLAAYVAWANGAELPQRKKKPQFKSLAAIAIYGAPESNGFEALRARAEGNVLCRELTILPPNELTPELYRQRIRKIAKDCGWEHEEFGLQKLRKMGAGAFVAVAQGSFEEDAAIVHLRYRHRRAKHSLALVGKGICFDTGGHNLKPARSMHGMHQDMNGSAVCLGILLGATRAELAVNVDCWLAIAQNHIGPKAYKQNEVVKALNGTTIEIVHTDAEGRMVLADTLTMAAKGKPAVIIDFATLTGSMVVALGERYSGVLGNREGLLAQAVAAGKASGERMCLFPLDEDYEQALDSKIADIKQCTLDGEADHILAGCFLKRFVHDLPWLHVDLSASSCKGGLGAVASDITGFGVGWGMEMIKTIIRA